MLSIVLDVLLGFEAIQLVESLEHSSLYFTITAGTALHTRRTDRFVKERSKRRGDSRYRAITNSSRTTREPSPMNF